MSSRRLTPDDADTYRTIRLRALRADPHAFGSSYEVESGFDDATWRERLSGFRGRPGVVIVSPGDGEPTGVVGVGLSDVAGDALLWGMWVDPVSRGTGMASELVDGVIAWARESAAKNVVLWVMRENTAAIAFYERCGFEDAHDWAGEQPAGCSEERCLQMSIYAASP